MYLRYSTVKRGDRVYRYAQLVESYRREDGTPTNRVLLNLGAIDEVTAENLRAALDASRKGKAVVLPEKVSSPRARPEVVSNFRYLDLAVLLRLWKDTGLERLVERALPAEGRTVSVAEVVTALVLQRCTAPASKLAAEAWYPKTALPELQGIKPEQFNNSRIHRALTALDKGEDAIQAGLAPLIRQTEGAFATLFIDATDTWFVGQGPPMASKGHDKEGLYRRRVGLVMLCDQRGFPLRWETLDGRYHDPTALADMAKQAAGLSWTKGLPLVMDRAAGHAGATADLNDLGLHYLTALPDSELISSGAPIPWTVLDPLQTETTVDGVQERLLAGGFRSVAKDRLLHDLGVFEKSRSASASRVSIATEALRIVEQIEIGPTHAAVAARLGTVRERVSRHKPLIHLCDAARDRIRLDGLDRLGLEDLKEVAALPANRQVERLEELQTAPGRKRRSAHREGPPKYRSRGVISFSPARFLHDRQSDLEHLTAIDALVEDVNRRLAHPSNRRTDASAAGEVTELVRKFGLGSVISVHILWEEGRRRVSLVRDDAAWAQRRRGDGISVILAHPDVEGTDLELVQRYFAKDAIEKDFQTIKSVIELRPVHHRTDPKLRAHVTICVLGLLLLRLLGSRLSRPHGSILQDLKETRLNLITEGTTSYHTITRPTSEVSAILKKLGYERLIDDVDMTEQLTPR